MEALPSVTKTDIIRQLWLDNNFYGTVFSAQYHKYKTEFTVGGGWNGYDGKHYGIVKWAKMQQAAVLPITAGITLMQQKMLHCIANSHRNWVKDGMVL